MRQAWFGRNHGENHWEDLLQRTELSSFAFFDGRSLALEEAKHMPRTSVEGGENWLQKMLHGVPRVKNSKRKHLRGFFFAYQASCFKRSKVVRGQRSLIWILLGAQHFGSSGLHSMSLCKLMYHGIGCSCGGKAQPLVLLVDVRGVLGSNYAGCSNRFASFFHIRRLVKNRSEKRYWDVLSFSIHSHSTAKTSHESKLMWTGTIAF